MSMVFPPLLEPPPLLLDPPLLLLLLLLPQAPSASTVPASRQPVMTYLPRCATVPIALPRRRMLLLLCRCPVLGCPVGAQPSAALGPQQGLGARPLTKRQWPLTRR